MTDDLIARLSADLKPVRPGTMQRHLLLALTIGAVVAAITMLVWLGLRADIATAPATMMFWTKSAYTFAMAVFGGVATLALSRPDGEIRWPWLAAFGLAVTLAILSFIQMAIMPPEQTMRLVIGSSSLVCPWYIIALSLPVLAAVLWVMRRFAPASPTMAGLAAGLFAGGTGAWIYSFHCGENGMMFLTLWYTLGIMIVAGLGALLGRFALRW